MSFVPVSADLDLSGFGEDAATPPADESGGGGSAAAPAALSVSRFVPIPGIQQSIISAARTSSRKKWLWIGGGVAAATAAAAFAAWWFWLREPSDGDDERRSNKAKRSKYKLSPSTSIQTLIFPKRRFPDLDDVRGWLADHDEFTGGKIDETSTSYRVRQQAPGRMGKGTFRTIKLGRSGVKAVVAKKKIRKAA